jgi:hypothetical protein
MAARRASSWWHGEGDDFTVMENGEPDFGRPSWVPPDDVRPAVVP